MVSAVTAWYRRTKPFFVNSNGIKVKKENDCKHFDRRNYLKYNFFLGNYLVKNHKKQRY